MYVAKCLFSVLFLFLVGGGNGFVPTVQGMLKFTLTVIIETAKNIRKDTKRMEILHSLYNLLGEWGTFMIIAWTC